MTMWPAWSRPTDAPIPALASILKYWDRMMLRVNVTDKVGRAVQELGLMGGFCAASWGILDDKLLGWLK
jgi:hypothetical protein